MRIKITGISSDDAYHNGYKEEVTDIEPLRKSVIGLTGEFNRGSDDGSLDGYVCGTFRADNGEFDSYFYAVQFEEIKA